MIAPRIVLVTDPAFGDDVIVRCVRRVADALPGGWLCVQLRDKRRPLVGLRVFASQLRRVTREVGASLVINGEALVARDVGADGVHLGGGAGTAVEARARMGRSAWVSVAAHSDDEARAALDEGADAVLVSPVFSTRVPSLPGRLAPASAGANIGARADAAGVAGAVGAKAGRGVEALRSARAIAGHRASVYALGGVTAENAPACVAAGADGIAVIRALLASPDPHRVARALHDAVARRC